MNKDRDRYLAEKMGLCDHEWMWSTMQEYSGYRCSKCGDTCIKIHSSDPFYKVNFSTWQGFGELWTWFINSEYYDADFVCSRNWRDFLEVVSIINPDKFADDLYEYFIAIDENQEINDGDDDDDYDWTGSNLMGG